MVNITDWMLSWGWQLVGPNEYHKLSASGLIIAVSGDATWSADCARAGRYEQQLLETRVQ